MTLADKIRRLLGRGPELEAVEERITHREKEVTKAIEDVRLVDLMARIEVERHAAELGRKKAS